MSPDVIIELILIYINVFLFHLIYCLNYFETLYSRIRFAFILSPCRECGEGLQFYALCSARNETGTYRVVNRNGFETPLFVSFTNHGCLSLSLDSLVRKYIFHTSANYSVVFKGFYFSH